MQLFAALRNNFPTKFIDSVNFVTISIFALIKLSYKDELKDAPQPVIFSINYRSIYW